MKDGVILDGYKLTEVGVIPCDWEVANINTYCHEIFLGLTAKVDYVKHYGIPLIRATDISNGKLIFKSALLISHKQHKSLTKYRQARLGDILVSKSGSLGVCALVDTNKEFSIYESIIVLQPIVSKITSLFLLCVLTFKDTQNRLLGDTVGSTVGHLNLNNFKKLSIPLPPLPEQKRIAKALSDIDELITALDKLITKKRYLKQGAMQQLLTGKTRLPGFTGAWEMRRLGEVVDIQMGQSPNSKYYNLQERGVPLIQGNADIDNRKTLIRIYTEQITKTCDTNDIIMTVRAPVGYVGIASCYSCIGRGVCSYKVHKADKIYTFYMLIFQERDWDNLGQGSTFTAINSNEIYSFKIFIPLSIQEQKAIAQILTKMDEEIEALEKKRDKYKKIKQGMMSVLLTGRTRLM